MLWDIEFESIIYNDSNYKFSIWMYIFLYFVACEGIHFAMWLVKRKCAYHCFTITCFDIFQVLSRPLFPIWTEKQKTSTYLSFKQKIWLVKMGASLGQLLSLSLLQMSMIILRAFPAVSIHK